MEKLNKGTFYAFSGEATKVSFFHKFICKFNATANF